MENNDGQISIEYQNFLSKLIDDDITLSLLLDYPELKPFVMFADKEFVINNFDKNDRKMLYLDLLRTKISIQNSIPRRKWTNELQTACSTIINRIMHKSKRSEGGFEREMQVKQIQVTSNMDQQQQVQQGGVFQNAMRFMKRAAGEM